MYSERMKHKNLHIAFTGGGTGGHIFPIVSLIEYAQQDKDLQAESKQIYRFGQGGSMEEKEATKLSGVHFVPLLGGKIRRYWDLKSTLQNARDMLFVKLAFFQSLHLLRKHNIDVVFCKWWYVALPVCFAARCLRIPVMLHESDLHAWLTNRVVAKLATKIFTWFPWVFKKEHTTVGQIFSDKLMNYRKHTLDIWVVDLTKTNVLVMGGSQGMSLVFETLANLLATWKHSLTNFFVVLGTKNNDRKTAFAPYSNVRIFDFLSQNDIWYLYAICDLAITRAWVTSLAEQQLFGIKKIIIPTPFTGWNHQFYNWLRYSEKFGDLLIEQNERLSETLWKFLQKFDWRKKDWTHIDEEEVKKAKEVIWESIRSMR